MRIDPNLAGAPDGGRTGGPPAPWLLQAELPRAVSEFAAFLTVAPLLQAVPRGDSHPVLVLPGFLAGDASTLTLRQYLGSLGYPVHGWRLGRNTGPSPQILARLDEVLRDLADVHGQAVSLVGWSLGGVYARELARRDPDRVRQVVTLASPFGLSDPQRNRTSQLFDEYSHLRVEPAEVPPATPGRPVPAVPSTAIYSRSDGIVAWQTCLVPTGPRSENVEVYASHCGMGHNPSALYVIADRLARPPAQWTPFRAPLLLRPLYPSSAAGPRAV